MNLSKEDHFKVPVWVKLHDVPLSGFTDDGLSVIASKIGKPLMLDSYTSSTCINAWGRPSYARATIEVSIDVPLREKVVVATPCNDEFGGYTKDVVSVEYEWKPPQCSECKVFGHIDSACPFNIPKTIPIKIKDADGFQEVTKKKGKGTVNKNKNGFPMGKKQRVMYRPVANKNVNKNTNSFSSLHNLDENGNPKETNTVLDVKLVDKKEELGKSVYDKPADIINEEKEGSNVEEERGPTTEFMVGEKKGASTPIKDCLDVQSSSVECPRYEPPPKTSRGSKCDEK